MSDEIVDFDRKSRIILEIRRGESRLHAQPSPELQAEYQSLPKHEIAMIINVLDFFKTPKKTWAEVAKN